MPTSAAPPNCLLLPAFVVIASLLAPVSGAQQLDRATVATATQAVEHVLMTPTTAAAESFIGNDLSDNYRSTLSTEALRQLIDQLRQAVVGAGSLDVGVEDGEILLTFGERPGEPDAVVVVRVEDSESPKIGFLGLRQNEASTERNEGPDPIVELRIRAVEGLATASTDEALRTFARAHFTDSLLSALSDDQTLALLRDIRRYSASAGGISISGDGAGNLTLAFRGSESANVLISFDPNPPNKIASLSLNTDVTEEFGGGAEVEPIEWATIDSRLAEEERRGFAGTVLVVRDGEIVLHRGYGKSNRETGLMNSTETIYDIGSAPIDFTRAAILKLADDGMLRLDDTIATYLDAHVRGGVPADRRGMTIEHLMSGRSGLPNFHHRPDVDQDYDLSWIDRSEALRRLMEQPLLFPPGQGESHSHSAFVLLAAIVEVASGEAYPDYLQRVFFNPIGMDGTGFYGRAATSNAPGRAFPDDRQAVGYGMSRVGNPNIPNNWGQTSWLVMGSGGMVSNPLDMLKWLRAIKQGDFLSRGAKEVYHHGGALAGGSDRGFWILMRDDADNTAIVCSNAHQEPGDLPVALSNELVRLVSEQ
jgi:CubicO group peptidase (beta-lactamase class C family)